MSVNKDDNSSNTIPCQNKGCTFWGRPATEGFCSKCYNEKMKERAASSQGQQQQQQQMSPARPQASIAASETSASLESQSAPMVAEKTATAPMVTPRKVQEAKNRCFTCNKKIGLTGIECRCGYVFCGAHRYPDTHSCDFDFKKHERELLAKSNEKVVGSKLIDKL